MVNVNIYLDSKEAEKLAQIAGMLKVMAHPMRINIMHLLEQHEELSVNEICKILEAEQSLISHHLYHMRQKDLLQVKKMGRHKYYALKNMKISRIIDCMDQCDLET